MTPWTVLGLDATRDRVAIKRAYARQLKQCRPDEDAAGYQRLRECYEWALAWAQAEDAGAVAALDAPDSVEPRSPTDAAATATAPSSTEATADIAAEPADAAAAAVERPAAAEAEAPPIDPEGLARSFYAHFEAHGAEATVAALPALQYALDGIALARRDETSRWFAALVVEVPALPDAVVAHLLGYFGWLSDYRSAAVLGPERVEALRARARLAGLVAHSADTGQTSEPAAGDLDPPLGAGARIGYRLLWAALCTLTILDPLAGGGDPLIRIVGIAVALLLARHADAIIREVLRNGGDQLPSPPGGWRWAAAVTLPVLAGIASQWIPSVRLDFLAASVGSVGAILLGWASARAWRSVPVLQAAAATWLLVAHGQDPLLSWCGSLSAALAYAAIADLKAAELRAIASAPLRAWLPSTGWGWFWMILAFKLVAMMLLIAPILMTPFVSLLQAERHGMPYARLTLGTAVALGVALRLPPDAAALLVLAAPWLSGPLRQLALRCASAWKRWRAA